ncbi:HMG box domain-containing protein [Mycena indigotica]|uniref:HMG box domain-containing protein n=1 Tax=Mycena indigotica TaxID=2126181 RepID=A0A8H6WH21_9AGAR|nr:HMG box domain-containing protein [Mycena indigotica]KAF7316531.1 HMG box domain-containing protein [Mycena indigotica]
MTKAHSTKSRSATRHCRGSSPYLGDIIYKKKPSDGHIRRPRNAFICYRSWFVAQAKEAAAQPKSLDQTTLSQSAAISWKALPAHEKARFRQEATEEKERHAEWYPDYKYCPNGLGPARKSSSSSRSSASSMSPPPPIPSPKVRSKRVVATKVPLQVDEPDVKPKKEEILPFYSPSSVHKDPSPFKSTLLPSTIVSLSFVPDDEPAFASTSRAPEITPFVSYASPSPPPMPQPMDSFNFEAWTYEFGLEHEKIDMDWVFSSPTPCSFYDSPELEGFKSTQCFVDEFGLVGLGYGLGVEPSEEERDQHLTKLLYQ